jgi:hypothetical protein
MRNPNVHRSGRSVAMTTAVGDELMEAMGQLRILFPDWRVGQLVASLVQAAGCDGEGAMWEVEDDQLLAAARRLIERNRDRYASHDLAEPQ